MTFGRRQLTERVPAGAAIAAPPLQAASQPEPAGDQQHCANAAGEFLTLLLAAYTLRSGLQPPAAVAAGAALIGEFALRSTGVPLPERGVVPGDATNDILYRGALEGRATAWMFLMHGAIEAGVATYELPKIEDVAARIAPRADGSFPLSVPEQYHPLEWPLNAGPRLRHRIIAIADTHDLSLREATIGLAAATAQLMIRTRNELPPRIGVTLAAETMLSVARLAPLPEPVTA